MLDWETLSNEQKQAVKLICEQSLMGFQRCFFNMMTGGKWAVNWHHKYIATSVERIIAGEQGPTIFNIPPGAGKTETMSIHAPVYSFIKTGKVRNLNISFSSSLAKRNSRRTRDIIKSAPFQELWPSQLSVDQAEEWKLVDAKGLPIAEVVSQSIGGQITGGRGGYPEEGFTGWLCLDDIDKPSDMFSEIKRSANHSKISDTLPSRLGNNSDNPTPVIAIQQRLHVDDSTAYLMAGGMGGIKFGQVIVPALIDEAYIESLPDWIRDECWKSVKGTKQINGYWSYWPASGASGVSIESLFAKWKNNEYTFMAQYMQSPISLGGRVFDTSGFLFYGEGCEYQLPRMSHRFITADTAQKTKTYNDFSVVVHWGKGEDGNLYALNMWRGKWESKQLRDKFTAIAQECARMNAKTVGGAFMGNLRTIYIEDKSSGTGLIQELRGELPVPITALQRNTDKTTRALDAAPQIALGRVRLPGNLDPLNDWTQEFVSEHGLFTPNDSHKHDDIVDNTCDAVQEELLKSQGSIVGMMFKPRN